MSARRFRVGLSFSGDDREFVKLVAKALSAKLGEDRVLYDEYLTAELARQDMDLHLASLYRNESDLIVPFYSAQYAERKWCNLEWRQMRDILFNAEEGRVMPFRFDDTPIAGVLSIDGYVKIAQRTAPEVAKLILKRLESEDPGQPELGADLAEALASAFGYDELASHFQGHLGTRLDAVIAREEPEIACSKLVDWAGRRIGWTRPLARILLEEGPQNALVTAFAKKHREFAARLTQEEREQLRQCLAAVVTTYAELRKLFRLALALDPNDFIEGPPADDSPAGSHLRFLVRRADHFDQIEAFIEAALVLFPGPLLEGKAKPLLDDLRNRQRASLLSFDDPFEACDLGGKLFINRKRLRESLRNVTADLASIRVVAVKGPSRSGKSHSIYYIEHIERLGKFEKAVVRLEQDDPPATFTPRLLIESVLDLIGGDTSRIPAMSADLTETRWVRRMADYLVGQIKSRGKILLIVLDGFANPNLHPLTRELVRELIKRAASESKLRIALLDYTDDLLPVEATGRYDTEPISQFTEADLRRFFLGFAHALGKNPTPEVIDTIVTAVLTAVPCDCPERNEKVALEVEQWTQKLGGHA
jgi:TIR domain